jgi:hypothetical protein
MIDTIETLVDEAQAMGLHITPNLVPYVKKAMNNSSQERQRAIECAFKGSSVFREHYEMYVEGAKQRFSKYSNVCYIDSRIEIKNFTDPEMDEVILAGLAECYLFNKIIRKCFDTQIPISWSD